MPVRLASSPNGHGFAALWVEFSRPPSGRSKTNGSKSAQAGLEPFVFDRPVIVTPYFRNRLSLSMQQSPSFQRIGYDNHRKIRNRASIKTKVLGEEGGGCKPRRQFLGRRRTVGCSSPQSQNLFTAPQHAQRSILAPSRKRICILSGGKISCTTPLPNLG